MNSEYKRGDNVLLWLTPEHEEYAPAQLHWYFPAEDAWSLTILNPYLNLLYAADDTRFSEQDILGYASETHLLSAFDAQARWVLDALERVSDPRAMPRVMEFLAYRMRQLTKEGQENSND